MSDMQIKKCQNCANNKSGFCIIKNEQVINIAKFNFSCQQFKPLNRDYREDE